MAATKLTREELVTWHRSFLEQYPRGHINKKEFIDIFNQLYKRGRPEKFSEFAFGAFDEDGNGKLSFHEFITSTAFFIRSESPSDENAERFSLAFDIFDV
jgi:Ca2+-binding EF-hand superfamily protein